jgi:hypothetical protein
MPHAHAGTTGMEPSTALRWAAQFRVGDPGWHCHPLSFGAVEQALTWQGGWGDP